MSRERKTYTYIVTYQHSHGRYNTDHKTTVEAHNAKEACEEVLRRYYESLDKLYERRGSIKGASKYGCYYPFHRHAERVKPID